VTLADVNVLVAAFRTDAPLHDVCRAWLARTVNGEARFGLSPLVLGAVVRITTNRRAFVQPSAAPEVFRFCDDLLNRPAAEVIEPGPRHWTIFSRLCVEAGVRGPMVTDAWYAALAIESGCEWITNDRDFARFPGLRWRRPDA
jgi:uncharacterized protein